MARDDRPGYWRATRRLMALTVTFALAIGLGVHLFASRFASVSLFDFPLGYLIAALVSPILLVVTAFLFAKRQDAIDRDYGMAGED